MRLYPYWEGSFEAFYIFGNIWTAISPTRITIDNRQLGSDGTVYIVLPDNSAPVDVTPKVTGVDYYTWTEPDPQKYQLALSFRNIKMSDWKQIDPLYPNITARLGVLRGDNMTFGRNWIPSFVAPALLPSDYVWSGVASGTGITITLQYNTVGEVAETLTVKGMSRTAIAKVMEIPLPNEPTWSLQNPVDAIKVLGASTEATTWAQNLCQHSPKAWNCRADAVRHAYWMALMINAYGLSSGTAQAAATAHERSNVEGGGNHNETVMDMENNIKGLGVPGGSKTAMQNAVRAMADRGELTVLDELPNVQERGLLVPSNFQDY